MHDEQMAALETERKETLERAEQLKQRAFQDACQSKSVAGCGPVPVAPLRHLLRHKLERNAHAQMRDARALAILSNHPEFEEFLELLGILNLIPNSDGVPLPPC